MSSYERELHDRISRAEHKVERIKNNAAPTVPKYDLTSIGVNNLLMTMSEIGHAYSTSLGYAVTMTISFEDVRPTDRIMVMAMAPSLPSIGAPIGNVYDVQDSKGNIYSEDGFFDRDFEASPPNVNEGIAVSFFLTDPQYNVTTGLTIGSDTITASWSNDVYDRFIQAWLIRFEPAITTGYPVLLARTDQNDVTVYAASQVTLSVPAFGPVIHKNSMLFGLTAYATASGRSIAYGGVGGYSGFYEASSALRSFGSARQSYAVHQQSSKANVYVVAGSVPISYEIDQGIYNLGANEPGFNGLGQSYIDIPAFTPATNFWKGAWIFYITNTS